MTHRIPKWLLRKEFILQYTPSQDQFIVWYGHYAGSGNSIPKAAKEARSQARSRCPIKQARDRGYKTLPGAPCLRKKRGKNQTGSLVAAVRYKL